MYKNIPKIVQDAVEDEKLAINLRNAAAKALESSFAKNEMNELFKQFTSNPRDLEIAQKASGTTTITTVTTLTTVPCLFTTTTTTTSGIVAENKDIQDAAQLAKEIPVNLNININPCK